MARQRFDISSKWLVQNQGKGALLVGGLEGVNRSEPMPGEVIQNRRYPDGLLQVFFGSEPKPNHVLMEIAFFGGQKVMIESPLIQKVQAGTSHELILDALKDRFGSTPRDVTKPLREIIDLKKLRLLNRIANKCADLDAFREALLA